MKKIIATVLASMMLAMPVMSMAESAVITPTAEIAEQSSVISVQGSASIAVEPDQAALAHRDRVVEPGLLSGYRAHLLLCTAHKKPAGTRHRGFASQSHEHGFH